MKKILYINGHAHAVWRWGLQGELLKRFQENKDNDIYNLDCNYCIKSHCWIATKKDKVECKMCVEKTRQIAIDAGIKKDHCLKLRKIKPPKFPNFKSIQEVLSYHYDGYEFGLGPVSSIMTGTRDYAFSVKKHSKDIKKHMETVYIVIKNLEELQEKYKFDEIHLFNGRVSFNYACVSFAKKHKIPYFIYDRGATINKIEYEKNEYIHNFYRRKAEIAKAWQNGDKNKEEKAIKWFNDRRAGKYQSWGSYTVQQKKDSLPKNFDFNKENITFFNSSMDEIYAFETWKHPLANTENEVIINILEHYKDDNSKHFYLRVHPNLKSAKKKKTTQIREINQIKKKYKNLTVIEPESPIDTYALIEASDKIIVGYSTAGCEANYYGKPAIITAKTPYEDFDCAYKAKSYNELYNLIDTKNLAPKPKENSYPFAYYYETFGEENKYFISEKHNYGKFLGKYIYRPLTKFERLKNLFRAKFFEFKNVL